MPSTQLGSWPNAACIAKPKVSIPFYPRLVSSLNNPQNSEMNFCENNEVTLLKIIIIMIAYTWNNFTSHMTIS